MSGMSGMCQESPVSGRQRGKIDKSHGFMKDITRNQIERSNYHEERSRILQLKKLHYDSDRNVRSSPQPLYQIPAQRKTVTKVDISVEISPGNFFRITAPKDQNRLDLANEIAHKAGMKEEFILALDLLLQQKMS